MDKKNVTTRDAAYGIARAIRLFLDGEGSNVHDLASGLTLDEAQRLRADLVEAYPEIEQSMMHVTTARQPVAVKSGRTSVVEIAPSSTSSSVRVTEFGDREIWVIDEKNKAGVPATVRILSRSLSDDNANLALLIGSFTDEEASNRNRVSLRLLIPGHSRVGELREDLEALYDRISGDVGPIIIEEKARKEETLLSRG